MNITKIDPPYDDTEQDDLTDDPRTRQFHVYLLTMVVLALAILWLVLKILEI